MPPPPASLSFYQFMRRLGRLSLGYCKQSISKQLCGVWTLCTICPERSCLRQVTVLTLISIVAISAYFSSQPWGSLSSACQHGFDAVLLVFAIVPVVHWNLSTTVFPKLIRLLNIFSNI